jgi:hypothetical protein
MKLPRRNYQKLLSRVIGVRRQTRITRLSIAAVVILGLLLPYLNTIYTAWHYGLDDKTSALVGTTSLALRKQFTFDAEHSQWQFNQKGIEAAQTKPQSSQEKSGPDPAAALALQKAQLGGTNDEKTAGSQYSVNLPTDGKKGITYYDNNTKLSFDLVPQFSVEDGKAVDGHLVYPFSGGGKLVYSAKNNGMKEDIILSKPMGDSLTFAYKLNLPDTLTAKLLDDGSLGIYSADPTLFGVSSFGTDGDVEKVLNAQKTAPKTHLLFALPAPIIKQTGGGQGDSSAHFSLDGDTLSVSATGLANLQYPLTIDPSVVVTSSSDFSAGNNEDNIDFSSNQLNRGNLTGGSIGAWHYTHNSTDDGTTYSAGFGSAGSARLEHGTAVYNGYIYITGGWTGSGTPFTDTLYAPINSDGTVGTWTAASYNLSIGHYAHETVAYNGYLYVIGGQTQFYTDNAVFYAPIASGGGLSGAWQSTTGSTYSLRDFAAVVYNGYLYKIGGTDGTRSNTVQYAPLNADGTISSGAWTTSSPIPFALEGLKAVAYNGRIIVTGGYTGVSYSPSTFSAKIKSDGSLGSWQTNTAMTTGRSNHSSVVYNGYIYVIGGDNGTMLTSIEYAPIYSSGSIGAWKTSSALSTGFKQHTSVVYGGYIYTLGGYMGTYRDYVQYAKIDVSGVVGTSTTSPNLFPSESSKGKTYTGRQGAASVAYNGYIYVLGGYDSSQNTYVFNSVIYAPLNNDGSIGSWSITTSFTSGRQRFAAVAYNNYMYILGGRDPTTSTNYNDVQYAPINSTGTLGAWVATTSFTTARENHSAVAYNGYLYVLSGDASPTLLKDVQYASISATGTVGAWSTTTPVTGDHAEGGAVIVKGRMYVIGGSGTQPIEYGTINTTGTISSWSTTINTDAWRSGVVAYKDKIYTTGGINFDTRVQFATVNSDGTLSAWNTTTSLNVSRVYSNTVAYNGYLYSVAGSNGATMNNNLEYAQIRNDGSGVVDNWTTNPNSFTTGRYGAGTVAYNGYLYVMGGIGSAGALGDVQYAPINDSGLVGTWATTTSLPDVRGVFGTVAYNGYMYIIGGAAGGGVYRSDVQHIAINGDGTLGASWTNDTAASLGSVRAGNKALVLNGYLYTLGGYDATNEYADVRYAAINSSTHAVGAWTSTNTYTGARYNFGCVLFNGYMYVIGGRNDALAKNWGDVQYAAVNGDGTVGTWATTTSYAAPRASQAAFAYNGYLYMTGGFDGSAYFASTQYAPLRSDGTVGNWQTSSTTSVYTNPRTVPGFVEYGGFAYVVGGAQGTNYYNDVQYTPIKLMPRIAHYSKRIDLGSAVSLSTITFNGTLTGGASSIMYRSAGTDGLWGSAAAIDTLSGGGGGGGCGGGGGTSRYVWLRVTVDDTNTPALSTSTNATDITVNYSSGSSHASPDFRLRGGKSYSSQALQPLDTCGA